MSLKERFRQASLVGAIMLAPSLGFANNIQNTDVNAAVSSPSFVQQQSWKWNDPKDKLAYESLPNEYKAFANKSFMERVEMKEEWQQRDFREREAKNKTNPSLDGETTAFFPYDEKIARDLREGRLTPRQATLAEELSSLGRPTSTIDQTKPYAEQLKDCGFDIFSRIVKGQKEGSLSPREYAEFVWQVQEAGVLRDLGSNNKSYILWKQSHKKEVNELNNANGYNRTKILSEEELKKFPINFENINGQEVMQPVKNDVIYHLRDEITRKVAEKIRRDDLQQKATTNKQQKNILRAVISNGAVNQ